MTGNGAGDLPFGLLDEETGNFIGFFDTDQAALAAVRDSIHRYGAASVETLALARFEGKEVEAVAAGQQLARRAMATVASVRDDAGAPAAAVSGSPARNS